MKLLIFKQLMLIYQHRINWPHVFPDYIIYLNAFNMAKLFRLQINPSAIYKLRNNWVFCYYCNLWYRFQDPLSCLKRLYNNQDQEVFQVMT